MSMNGKLVLACLLLLGSSAHVSRLPPAENPTPRPPLRNPLRIAANAAYSRNQFSDAEQLSLKGFKQAKADGDLRAAASFMNSAASARFAMFRYGEALEAYTEARRLARAAGDLETLAVVSSNLSSLYLHQNDKNASLQAAGEALAALDGLAPSSHAALLRAQIALVRSAHGDFESALALFGRALADAQLGDDRRTLALLWDQAGYELLKRGRFVEAERAFLEAFRLRKLHRLPDMQYSYYAFGMLHRTLGDARSARRLLDRALEEAERNPGTLPLWRVLYERGLASLESGAAAEALSDLRRSLEAARLVRAQFLPAESTTIGTSLTLHGVSAALIRAAFRLYRDQGDASSAALALAAAEDSRAASLRGLIYAPAEWRRRLPPEYWRLLSRMHAAAAAPQAGNSSLGELQYKLTEMEAAAGLTLPSGGTGAARAPSLERLQRSLRDDEAYFSFHLDEPLSYGWAVSREAFVMRSLPGRAWFEEKAGRFQSSVAEERGGAEALGAELYEALFASLPARVLAKPRWILALDGPLFDVPYAALVTTRLAGRPRYLIEDHALRIVPSAHSLSEKPGVCLNGEFVAIGDPVYNTADPRWRAAQSQQSAWRFGVSPLLFAGRRAAGGMELPRLPGSAREIESCARAWQAGQGAALLLEGEEACRKNLLDALKRRPAVVHFATHFVPSAEQSRQALLVLSLNAAGAPDLVGPPEISRWRFEVGLVTLSGCGSARGAKLPSEGLMGMTRAWLAAGARTVVASLWPVPDGQGEIFTSFYRRLEGRASSSGDAAEALRRAQLEALESRRGGEGRGHWAAYFVVGKD